MTTIETPDWISTPDGRDLYRTDHPTRSTVTVTRGRGPSVVNPRSWAEFGYLIIDLGISIAFFVGTVTLLAVGLGFSVIWVGVPILAFALVFARSGGAVQRGLAHALLDHRVVGPRGVRRTRPGPVGALTGLLTDGASWRAVGYHCVKIVLAPLSFGLAVGFYAAGLGALSYPIWRDDLPWVQAADGSWHQGWQVFGDVYLDTLPAILIQAAVGIGLLWVAPRLVRALTTMDRVLIATLLGARDR